MLKEFFVRASYLVILLSSYLLGNYLTSCIAAFENIEFKYILPIINLVFLDFYLNRFCLLDFRKTKNGLHIKPNDDNKVIGFDIEFLLTYRGSGSILFQVTDVEVRASKKNFIQIKPSLICEKLCYDPPEDFSCTFDKAIHTKKIILSCKLPKRRTLDDCTLVIHYLVNGKKHKKKRVHLRLDKGR